ncbi:unnamed protein product [Ambrosiozyma monospora]|uniref:Unnamed protein product n=1 Tax=Ambrosiozyma monospora TaxID=43982 RepID=A0ACB5TNM0_AMBMO|nr:unnamed protein product [Ambrosiozyma monospora]
MDSYLRLCYSGLPKLLNVLESFGSPGNGTGNGGTNAGDRDADETAVEGDDTAVAGVGANGGGAVEKFELPSDVFQFVFPSIYKFILRCSDDQLLQTSSEVFNEFLKVSSNEIQNYRDQETNATGNEILLKIVSKFLSPELSDQAIAKLGDLINLVLTNFQSSELVQCYFEDVLKAVTLRLIHAKEIMTVENLILIFNKLTVVQPQGTIDFLTNFQVTTTTTTTTTTTSPGSSRASTSVPTSPTSPNVGINSGQP